MYIVFPKENAWILCALWKRGQKVNGRWPRTGSRRRTRPDAAIRPLTFTATEEKVPKKAQFRRNSTFSLKSLAYRQSIKFKAALCRTTTKLQNKEQSCHLEINQDLLNLIGVKVCDRLKVLYPGIWAMEAINIILLLLNKLDTTFPFRSIHLIPILKYQ